MGIGTAGRSAEAEARRLAALGRPTPPGLLAGLAAAVLLLAGRIVSRHVPGAFLWFVVAAVVIGVAVWVAARRPLDVALATLAVGWLLASPVIGAVLAPSRFPQPQLPTAGSLALTSAVAAAGSFLVARRHAPTRAAASLLTALAAFVAVGLLCRWTVPTVEPAAALTAAGIALAARGGGWRAVSARAERWRRGAAGERATGAVLDCLDASRFKVFHDLAVPGTHANVDHLVIGPTGVFVIDTKLWAGTVTERADGVWYANKPLREWLASAGFEADRVAALLGCEVTLVVCVHGATLPRVPLVVVLPEGRYAWVVPAGLLLAGLAGAKEILNRGTVRQLAWRARRTLGHYGSVTLLRR